MSICLIPVTEEDVKEVLHLENCSSSPYFAAYEGEEAVLKYIQSSSVFFIQKGGQNIGTISFRLNEDDGRKINGLTVIPEKRGQGFGTEAMKLLLEDYPCKKWTLFVHPENTPALLIYLQLGFKIKEWKEEVFKDAGPRLVLCLNQSQ